MNPLELQWAESWLESFIKNCSRIVYDFPNLIENESKDE
jgi:hypothetical protein